MDLRIRTNYTSAGIVGPKEAPTGREIVGKIAKTKQSGSDAKMFAFQFDYGKGINKETDVFNTALMAGLITRAGSSYTYKDTKVVGRDNFISRLREDNELLITIRKDVLDNIANINISTIDEEACSDDE